MPDVFKIIAVVLIAAMACLLIIPALGTWQAATKRDADWSAPSLMVLAAMLTAAALFGGVTGLFNRPLAASAVALNLLWLAAMLRARTNMSQRLRP